MFSKCSLDVPNDATLREHSVNIPGILLAGWVVHDLSLDHLRKKEIEVTLKWMSMVHQL